MLGKKLFKKDYNIEEYVKMSDWANANGAEIVDRGEFYEIVKVSIPAPTEDEIQAQLTAAVQKWMDSKVQERNYDDVHTCVGTYLYSPVDKFRLEAEAVRDWVSYVWEHCYAVLSEVKAGSRKIPSAEELIAELPELKW